MGNRTNAPQIERRQEAERMVKLLEEAEGVLLDSGKRSQYDSSPPPAERSSAGAPSRSRTDGATPHAFRQRGVRIELD